MIIALGKHDGSVHLFATVSEAEAHFEAIDVENGEYEFCDDSGQRFTPEIVVPVGIFRTGSYRLLPTGAAHGSVRSFMISRARYLARGTQEVQSLEDLKR